MSYMSTIKRSRSWGSLAEALRRKIAESGLAFIEMERRTGGVVKRQTVMAFSRGEQESMRLDKADLLAGLFGLRVVEAPPDRKSRHARNH
jgi:hypothetical protein